MKIEGFDWDSNNWPKCGKHGVSRAEIEHVLRTMVIRIPDPNPNEGRYRTAGQTPSGRHVFAVFTYREMKSGTFIRPISARYMHGKEVTAYEQIKQTMANVDQ